MVSRICIRTFTSMTIAFSSGPLRICQHLPYYDYGAHVHLGKRRVNCGTANLDSDSRVERAHSELKGLERYVFVGEDAVVAIVRSERDANRDRVLVWSKPQIALGLLEYVVEKGIVTVVIHRRVGASADR